MNEIKKKNRQEERQTQRWEKDREAGRWIERGGGGQRGREMEKGREEERSIEMRG